jgi:hypothetical protein
MAEVVVEAPFQTIEVAEPEDSDCFEGIYEDFNSPQI